jgi:hypothetical protein
MEAVKKTGYHYLAADDKAGGKSCSTVSYQKKAVAPKEQTQSSWHNHSSQPLRAEHSAQTVFTHRCPLDI